MRGCAPGSSAGAESAFRRASRRRSPRPAQRPVAEDQAEDQEQIGERIDKHFPRRPVASEFVHPQSSSKHTRLETREPAVRRRNLDELSAIAADPARARQFLLRTSMIAMQRRAEAITLEEV